MNSNNTPPFREMFQNFQNESVSQRFQPLSFLEEFKDLQVLSQTLLQQEVKRLKAKLGENHPKVAKMEASLRHKPNFINELEVDLEIAQIQIPEIAEQDALIHGRIVDQSRHGLSGLTVSLEDQAGSILQTTCSFLSDASGYYALPINEINIPQLLSEAPAGIFLAIRNQANKVVYRSSEPIPIAKGDRHFFEIPLSRAC